MIALSLDRAKSLFIRTMRQIRLDAETSEVTPRYRRRLFQTIDDALQRLAELDKSRNSSQR